MKPVSIFRKMTRIIGQAMFLMLFICIVVLFVSGKAFIDFNRLFRQQQTFYSFENTLMELPECLFAYLNGTENKKEEILVLTEQLSEVAALLPEYFPHAQFTDTRLLTESYLLEVRALMEQYSGGENQEMIHAWECTEEVYQELVMQYKTTEPFQKMIINQKAQNIRSRWLGQLPIILILIMISAGISFVDSRKMVRHIVSPLTALTRQANRISEGGLMCLPEEEISSDADLEVYQLTEAFQCMSETIRQQMAELEEKIILDQKVHTLEMQNVQIKMQLSQAQMSQFQSLVNPHFLFNGLSMLSGMALLEQAEKTHEYALQIAQFLRTSLKHVGKIITLQEEMEHIRYYIQIQQQRFGERIAFLTECSPECEDAMAPAVILQPLVENSLIHGVASYPSGGVIKVQVCQMDDRICLSVEDNGVGMSEEMEKKLLESFCNPEYDQKKTGLYGVIYSLQYCFKDAVKMQIDRKEKGLKISFVSLSTAKNRTGRAHDALG